RQTVVPAPGAEALRALFDAPAPLTIGVEDEFMLLDPETLDLVPRAAEVLAAVADDARFKLELPASQLEIMLPPLSGADGAAGATPVTRRGARRSPTCCRATASRPRCARGRRTPKRCAPCPSPASGGGTCARTRSTARSRSARPTRRRASRTPRR